MSLSATSFVSLPLSTVPSVMMRTRLARTVVRLATESMTALSSATTLPTSSAVSAVTLVTWPEIAQTDSVDPNGATAHQLQLDQVVSVAVQQLAELVLAMLLIASTSNSCRNSPEVLHQQTQLTASRPDQEVTTKLHQPRLLTSSHGSVAQLAHLRHGSSAVVTITTPTATLHQLVAQLHGSSATTVVHVTTTAATTAMTVAEVVVTTPTLAAAAIVTMLEATVHHHHHQLAVLHLGLLLSHLLQLLLLTVVTAATLPQVTVHQLLATRLHHQWLHRQDLLVHQDSVRFSLSMEAPHHRHHQVVLLHLLLLVLPLHHHRAISHHHLHHLTKCFRRLQLEVTTIYDAGKDFLRLGF